MGDKKQNKKGWVINLGLFQLIRERGLKESLYCGDQMFTLKIKLFTKLNLIYARSNIWHQMTSDYNKVDRQTDRLAC